MHSVPILSIAAGAWLSLTAAIAQTIPPVVISEIAAATNENMATPSYDAIELHNPTDSPADISYWLISDDPELSRSHRIPAGTVIPPFGYHVLIQDVDTNQPLDEISYDLFFDVFGINANGEKTYLMSADAAGNRQTPLELLARCLQIGLGDQDPPCRETRNDFGPE